jgi:hypothetical protein
VNEGALGAFRSHLRINLKSTLHYYNALTMFKVNNTAAFVNDVFVEEDHVFVWKEGCTRDGSHLERDQKRAIVAYKDKLVTKTREKLAQRKELKTQKQTRLASIKQIEDVDEVTIDMTAAQLKDQLEIYRGLVNGIPLKSHLKTKAEMNVV